MHLAASGNQPALKRIENAWRMPDKAIQCHDGCRSRMLKKRGCVAELYSEAIAALQLPDLAQTATPTRLVHVNILMIPIRFPNSLYITTKQCKEMLLVFFFLRLAPSAMP